MKTQESAFQVLKFRQIATPGARELSLQQRPAVYAWYRSLQLGEATGSASRFLARIESLLAAKLSDQYSGRLGYLYQVNLWETGGALSPTKLELLQRIAEDDGARTQLAAILEGSTFLQAPLYVGKAIDLRQRISDHVTGSTDLLERFRAAGIPLESCVLRYKYVREDELATIVAALGFPDDKRAELAEAVVVLVEELLTRFSPSSFVRRPG